jgi:hypothetical protein
MTVYNILKRAISASKLIRSGEEGKAPALVIVISNSGT